MDREPDHHHEREVGQAPVAVQPPHAVDRGDADKAAFGAPQQRRKGRAGRDIAARRRILVGASHDDGPVGAQQRQRASGPESDAIEELAEVVEPQGADDDAAEIALGPRHPPAQADGLVLRGEPRLERLAEEDAGVGVVRVGLEVVAVGKVYGARRPFVRIEHEIAAGIGGQQRAHVLGVDRTVEQHALAQGGRQLHHFRVLHGIGDPGDGELVDMQVARDAALQRESEVGRGFAGAGQGGAAHLGQCRGAQSGDGNRQGEGRRDDHRGGVQAYAQASSCKVNHGSGRCRCIFCSIVVPAGYFN
ncbi:hypothetical protein D9M68_504350 [compost metagenome]